MTYVTPEEVAAYNAGLKASLTEQSQEFHASGEWTLPPAAIVTPVGWFSRLLWPLVRYRAYGTGRVVYVNVYGGGGSGGSSVPGRLATPEEIQKGVQEGGGGYGVDDTRIGGLLP